MKVILINGKSGTGKDTVAKYISNKVDNSIIIPNSYGVKKIAKEVFSIEPEDKTEITRFVCDNITSIGYKIYKYYWENKAYDSIKKYDNSVLIVPDFRIENTYDFYKYVADEIITIKLIGSNNRDTKNKETPTEYDKNLKNFKFDYEIETTGYTLENVYKIVDSMLHDEKLLKENYICKYAEVTNLNTIICHHKKEKVYIDDEISYITSKCPNDVRLDENQQPICTITYKK